MNHISKILFILGLLLALLFGYLRALGSTAWLVPWLLVGGVGIVCGLLNVIPSERNTAFLSLIGLVVALSAILLQDFNPHWLNAVVFFVRVFFAHVLLSFAFIHLFKPTEE
ncbi:MAG: hypothetical protein QOE34_2057 [Verrucomicrobiota bacterium]|jgi:hypothetical protein